MDKSFKVRSIIFGIKRLFGLHSGYNIVQLLIDVMKIYSFQKRLRFCVIDNASNNNTALTTIERYLATCGVIWSGKDHCLCCFGHVVSLIANAFTANKPLKKKKVARVKGAPKAPKVIWIRPEDAISIVHIITVYIIATSQRIEEFIRINSITDNNILHPIKENDTR